MITDLSQKIDKLADASVELDRLERQLEVVLMSLEAIENNLSTEQIDKNQLAEKLNNSLQLIDLYQVKHCEVLDEVKTHLATLISTQQEEG